MRRDLQQHQLYLYCNSCNSQMKCFTIHININVCFCLLKFNKCTKTFLQLPLILCIKIKYITGIKYILTFENYAICSVNIAIILAVKCKIKLYYCTTQIYSVGKFELKNRTPSSLEIISLKPLMQFCIPYISVGTAASYSLHGEVTICNLQSDYAVDQRPNRLVPEDLFQGLKRQECEANNAPQFNAKIKRVGIVPLLRRCPKELCIEKTLPFVKIS